jgi:ribosomal protein S18 acetylase RimI-like enzyme
VEIITATDKHIREIIELWKELMDFHTEIDSRNPRSKNGHLNWEKYLRELMKSENNLILVALERNTVVGFSISQISTYPPVFINKTYGFISDIAVKSGYRRKGIGEKMLAEIFNWFESHGIDRIELSVAAGNETGYSFWKKHGFKDFSHKLYMDI